MAYKDASWFLDDLRLMDQELDKLNEELGYSKITHQQQISKTQQLINEKKYAEQSKVDAGKEAEQLNTILGRQLGEPRQLPVSDEFKQGLVSGRYEKPPVSDQMTGDEMSKFSEFLGTKKPKGIAETVPGLKSTLRTPDQIERDMLNVLQVKKSIIPNMLGRKGSENIKFFVDEKGNLVSGTPEEISAKYEGKPLFSVTGRADTQKNATKKDIFWITGSKNDYFIGTAEEASMEAKSAGGKFYQYGKLNPEKEVEFQQNTDMLLVDDDGTIIGFGKGMSSTVDSYKDRKGLPITTEKGAPYQRIPANAYSKIFNKPPGAKTAVQKQKEKWVANEEAYRRLASEAFKDLPMTQRNSRMGSAMRTLREDEVGLLKLHDLFVDGDIKQYYDITGDTTLMSGIFEGKNQQAKSMETYMKGVMNDFHYSYLRKLGGIDSAIPVTPAGSEKSLSMDEWNNFKRLRINKQYELMRLYALKSTDAYVASEANHDEVLPSDPVNLVRAVLQQNDQIVGSAYTSSMARMNFNPDDVASMLARLTNEDLEPQAKAEINDLPAKIIDKAKELRQMGMSMSNIKLEIQRVFSKLPPDYRDHFINMVLRQVDK
jgi:hypothetical protein